MIFVTVGTHEQQFNRLIKYIDNMKGLGIIKEDVIMQIGYSTYEPKNCKWKRLIDYNEMKDNINKSRIIITHGGPASFIMPLQINKIPIVIPRESKYEEHVNNHQVEFVNEIFNRMGTIIPVTNIEELIEIINNYEHIISKMQGKIINNNKKFNMLLKDIINKLI